MYVMCVLIAVDENVKLTMSLERARREIRVHSHRHKHIQAHTHNHAETRTWTHIYTHTTYRYKCNVLYDTSIHTICNCLRIVIQNGFDVRLLSASSTLRDNSPSFK